MSNPIPSSLALTNIATGSPIISSTHDTNYSAIQTAVNEIITALNTGTLGQVLQSAGGSSVQWIAAPTAPYRKTTAKQVINTTTETDLLNGEITVAANALGATGALKLVAFGDLQNNSGATIGLPRFKLKLGATTLLDTNNFGGVIGASASRFPWVAKATILNTATNAQQAFLEMRVAYSNANGSGGVAFLTGEGIYQTVLATTAGANDVADAIGYNSAAVDTTSSQALALTVINATAGAAIDVTLKGAIVEIL